MYASNEELLREGECDAPNCIKDAGHPGPHSCDLWDTCECDYPHTSDFEPPFEACTCNPDCYHLTASRDIQEAIRKAAKGDEPCPS